MKKGLLALLALSLTACVSTSKAPTVSSLSEEILTALETLVERNADEGGYVIFNDAKGSSYYVQAAEVTEGTLHLEAVSDTYLSHLEELTQDQVNKLLDIGWDEPLENGNYTIDLTETSPETLASVAKDLEKTLKEVYQVTEIELDTDTDQMAR